MARFYGKVGYVATVETRSGIYELTETLKFHFGDVLKNGKRWVGNDGVNDDLRITNTISIIADHYATNNLQNIRFVEYMGGRWNVTSIDIQSPRILLTLGGVYNG